VFDLLPDGFWFWWTVFEWVIRVVMVLVILRRGFEPAVALSWLLLIALLPGVGLVIYLMVGVRPLGFKRVARRQRFDDERGQITCVVRAPDTEQVLGLGPPQLNMIRQAQRISGNPIVTGSRVELLDDADALARRLVADIDAAGDHVHLLYYIYRPDEVGRPVADAVARAAARGLTCRVILDGSGSKKMLAHPLTRRMREAGAEVVAALPVSLWRRPLARMDVRNHRKIAVVDGRVAYAGSHNIVREDYGHPWAGKWVDLTARYTGPVVAQLQHVFVENWAFETDQVPRGDSLFPTLGPTGDVTAQVVPTGPTEQSESFRRVLIAALNAAQRRIVMTTPYLIPDDATLLALSMAADRGVRVEIVAPRRADQPLVHAAGRAYVDRLLDAGVRLYLFRKGVLHAKTVTVDDAFAMIGSANLDVRSFHINFELSTLLYGEVVTELLRAQQQRYIARSDPLDVEAWRRRPQWKRYVDRAAALLSPLL